MATLLEMVGLWGEQHQFREMILRANDRLARPAGRPAGPAQLPGNEYGTYTQLGEWLL